MTAMMQSRIFSTLRKWTEVLHPTEKSQPGPPANRFLSWNRTVHCLSVVLLVVSSCGNKRERRNPQLEWEVAVCKETASLLPDTCVPRDQLTEANGGVINIEAKLKCGETLFCTWACVPKVHRGPFFRVKHGPWSLCELCFSSDPLPRECYDESAHRKADKTVIGPDDKP